jgi:prevent-host-death family protein
MKSDAIRQRWRDVMDEVAAGTDVLVERYNKPVAAVIPYEDYVALREELEEHRALRRAEAAWAEARRDPASAVAWEDLKSELDAAGGDA